MVSFNYWMNSKIDGQKPPIIYYKTAKCEQIKTKMLKK